MFVAQHFPPETKAKTRRHDAGRSRRRWRSEIKQLDWMSAGDQAAGAREAARASRNKIGYPDRWRDYSRARRSSATTSSATSRARTSSRSQRELAKIGKPVDRGEWDMTPPTVNAYYNPQMNDINFPAGVLQPPLYDPKMDDAPNYGNTGGTIGHELTHGFDDEGRQFDAQGQPAGLVDEGGRARSSRSASQCVVDQYAQYTIVDDIKINSKLTLGRGRRRPRRH